jgi:ribonuclease VapC
VIVDSSALVAILREEPGFKTLRDKIVYSEKLPRLPSPNYVETAVVIDGKRDPATSRKLDDLIEELEIEVVAFTPQHAKVAREAYRDYGKGSGHPAGLNFGDAMAYALAKCERLPLLFVGDDFVHTDIEAA